MVTFAPANPSARRPTTASGTWPGSTGSATYVQSISSAANAALWITGDRLCATGQPTTAATRVAPPIRGSATEALLNVPQMLLIGHREPVTSGAVGRTRHVKQVRGVRGMQGRLQPLRNRARDQRRRRAGVGPRVLRPCGLG